MSHELFHPETDAEILACLPVMQALRPHLQHGPAFVAQVRRQADHGYRLLALRDGGEVLACAGYRVTESLLRGRFLYVDDLVTRADQRSRGHGERLLQALVAEARAAGCSALVLDSGLDNRHAHRFYLRQRLDIRAFRFAIELAEDRTRR